MPTIQKVTKGFSVSNHAFDRVAERLAVLGVDKVILKKQLAEAVKSGSYIYRDEERSNSVFRCWMETDKKKREELFVVMADDGCVVTVIDRQHVFKNRARKWGLTT